MATCLMGAKADCEFHVKLKCTRAKLRDTIACPPMCVGYVQRVKPVPETGKAVQS
jgi:hypothetical protein